MPRVPPPVGDRDAAASRVRFRRAVTLLVMTLLLPGSAQVAAGRRDVGRLALRIAAGSLASLVLVVALGLAWHGVVYWMVSNAVKPNAEMFVMPPRWIPSTRVLRSPSGADSTPWS